MTDLAHPSVLAARPVSSYMPRPVTWLWPEHLPHGKLAILDGDPGLGKSLVALDLCARLSTGGTWPDGSPIPAAGTCLVINGEDGEEDTTGPRLRALGADPGRVFFLTRAETAGAPPLRLPGQTSELEAALQQTKARLVVLDPLLAFLGTEVQLSSDASVRRALAPLARLAALHDCVFLLIRHLTKRAGLRSLYRGLGSIGLVAACRTAWLVAADPQEPARRVLAQLKNNLAPPQPSLAFELEHTAGEVPRVRWLGTVEQSADALLAQAAPQPRSTLECARDFLLDFLHDGPRTTRDIWKQGEALGLIQRTLRRAKDALEIRLVEARVAGKRASYWLLPGQELPPGAVGHTLDPELRAALEEMNRLYPPATPLDDVDTL